ncbi:hypothetical protein L484_003458 [Morus notabilis]|uniref:BZIP domain-containing protein n=1 Tax=Morus notabilis TaxID=981085 RepID=W9RR93_9ROSA|nr:hypothetical protein L484_003458 [Morus notabilis]
MAKDEWMRTAMSDDMLVVELLVRLKQSQAAAASPLKSSPPSQPSPTFPLTWSVRLPRSRALRCDAVSQRKQGDVSTRCSPTTPLSWSGAASPSATADGFEESSRPSNNRSPSQARSKVLLSSFTFPLRLIFFSLVAMCQMYGLLTKRRFLCVDLNSDQRRLCTCLASSSVSGRVFSPVQGIATNNELASAITTSRRSRRKKTFAELKEEENSLLKERVHLKRELAKLRATFKEQREKNDSLKRMKLELHVDSAKYVNADGFKMASSSQPQERIASTSDNVRSTMQLAHHSNAQSDSFDESNTNSNRDGFFLLPDLNSLPCDEDYGSETFYGSS